MTGATTGPLHQRGSQSIDQPAYWWFEARSDLLHRTLGSYVGHPHRLLDVGSADGPSVEWLRGPHDHVSVDLDPRGLKPGEGVCASAEALPFRDGVFDVVTAFDVIEHCPDEDAAIGDIARVLAPGGRFLVSVPAYQWAWSDHDERAGHYRRYTRARITDALERNGLRIERATYGFTFVFPFFLAERAIRRARGLRGGHDVESATISPLPPAVSAALVRVSRAEARVSARRDLAFGSSVFVAALKA